MFFKKRVKKLPLTMDFINVIKPGDVILIKARIPLTRAQTDAMQGVLDHFKNRGFEFLVIDSNLDVEILRRENNVIPLTKGKSDV